MVEEAAPPLAALAPGRVKLLALSALLAVLTMLLLASPALAEPSAPPAWAALNPQQQEVLSPLRERWNSLDAADRARWLGVAKRFPSMTPIGQKRVQTRMHKWAKLTPDQRAQARARYERMQRERKSKNLREQWQEYQSLPAERRKAFAPDPGSSRSARKSNAREETAPRQ